MLLKPENSGDSHELFECHGEYDVYRYSRGFGDVYEATVIISGRDRQSVWEQLDYNKKPYNDLSLTRGLRGVPELEPGTILGFISFIDSKVHKSNNPERPYYFMMELIYVKNPLDISFREFVKDYFQYGGQ
jgi:hypothetical protein